MKTAIDIVKNMVFPQLEKDLNFSQEKYDTVFWEKFAQTILRFESDAKPVYTLIYSLELSDPEKLIAKLPNFYSKFLKELAENYVVGQTSEAIDYLLNAKSGVFLKEVQFFQILKQVIKKAERQRIKEDLPNSYNRLAFELSESDIANTVKKKAREDLKAKFKQWDMELQKEEVPVIPLENKKQPKQSKVIRLSLLKYAAAACVVVTAWVLYYKFSNNTVDGLIQQNENTVVTTGHKKEVIEKIPVEKPIEKYIISSSKLSIQYPSDLGFTNTSSSKIITLSFKDASLTIKKLHREIESKVINNELTAKDLKNKLQLLEANQGKYEFNGKQLVIYSKKTNEANAVLSTDDKSFYLKKGNNYYYLNFTKQPQVLKPVNDSELKEQLEKISFENQK